MAMLVILVILLAALALTAAVTALGAYRWAEKTRRLRVRLEGARLPRRTRNVDFRELEGLPAPVQSYFRAALRDGQPMVAGVRVRHQGTFNLGDTTDRWRPFTSEQRVITCPPGFDWDARVRILPGLTVRVHDAYVAGEGILHAAILGLFTVADLRGSREIAAGELLRFFAEAAWYPTALLPSQGVHWEALNAHSARATLSEGATGPQMLFTFGADGLIETVRAEARARAVGKDFVPTPWQGRFWNYTEHAGMRVPLDGEVAWLLPAGEKSYWRGCITEIAYEFAQ